MVMSENWRQCCFSTKVWSLSIIVIAMCSTWDKCKFSTWFLIASLPTSNKQECNYSTQQTKIQQFMRYELCCFCFYKSDRRTGKLKNKTLSWSDLVSSGNALARVQQVHKPADLRDITFCTHWFWGFNSSTMCTRCFETQSSLGCTCTRRFKFLI